MPLLTSNSTEPLWRYCFRSFLLMICWGRNLDDMRKYSGMSIGVLRYKSFISNVRKRLLSETTD